MDIILDDIRSAEKIPLKSTTLVAFTRNGFKKVSTENLVELNSKGKIPVQYLDFSGLKFMGVFDAENNNPLLSDSIGNNNEYYIINNPGTQDLGSGDISLDSGDYLIYSDSKWNKVANSSISAFVNTIDDLRNLDLKEAEVITLLGYYESGDKDPLNYKYTTIDYNLLNDDGGSIIKANQGSWIAQFGEFINVEDFGDFDKFRVYANTKSNLKAKYIKPKIINLTASKIFNSAIEIDFNHAEFYFNLTGAETHGIIFNANCKIRNLKINSNKGTIYSNNAFTELDNVTSESSSVSIHSVYLNVSELVKLHNSTLKGGAISLYAVGVGNSAICDIYNNNVLESKAFDNINLENLKGGDITKNNSDRSSRSGIVIGINSENLNVFNNYCRDNKVDQFNEGGWGVVATYGTKNCNIYSNHLSNNENGGVTLDLFTDDGLSHDGSHKCFANSIDGGLTGVSLNGCKSSAVYSNNIKNVLWGVRTDEADNSKIYANNIKEMFVGAGGYHIQTYKTKGVDIFNNTFENVKTLIGNISIVESSDIKINDNTFRLLSDGGNNVNMPVVFLNSDTLIDNISIVNNTIEKNSTGFNHCFNLVNPTSANVKIDGNIIKGATNAFNTIINASGTPNVISTNNKVNNIVSGNYAVLHSSATPASTKIDDYYVNGKFTYPLTKGLTWQRPTGEPDLEGFEFYDSQIKKKIIYNGTAWVNVDGSNII